jgi:hypothetical protein
VALSSATTRDVPVADLAAAPQLPSVAALVGATLPPGIIASLCKVALADNKPVAAWTNASTSSAAPPSFVDLVETCVRLGAMRALVSLAECPGAVDVIAAPGHLQRVLALSDHANLATTSVLEDTVQLAQA